MAWNRRSLQEALEDCLEHLPDGFGVQSIGPAHVVVGPTGVFVVLAHDGSLERARGLGRLAATIRSAFAERMAWVPFVHALLVDDQSTTIAQATVVPPDLLAEVLTEGRRTLEDETIATICELISSGALAGLESVAPAMAGARMHRCFDLPAAPASSSPSIPSDPLPRDFLSSTPMPPASTGASGSRSPAG